MTSTRTWMCFVALVFSSWLTSCSDKKQESADAGLIERGPKLLAIDGDPNGLWWDDPTQTLYVADDNGNRILRWRDVGGFSLVKDLPTAPAEGAGLGQVVLTGDGSIVVTRFGYGTTGDIVYVPPTGDPQIVAGLDAQRRRIGLTVTSDGRLFDSWFVRLATGERVGSVGELSLAGTEVEIVTGLKKPVGVLVAGQDLFISDQDLGQVLKAPLADPAAYTVLAAVQAPDLLAVGPDGVILTGSTGGNLYRIGSSGDASVVTSGFHQVRGVAYDPTNRRIFVADHDADETDGVTHALHVIPAD